MSGILESFPYWTENVMSLTYFPYFVSASWVTPSPFQLISQDDNILQVLFVLLWKYKYWKRLICKKSMRFNFNGLAWVFSIPPSSKCSMILRWETLQCTAPYNVQGPPSISSEENSSLRNTIHNSINPAPLCLCEQTKTKIKLNSNLLFQVLLKLSVILPNWIKGEDGMLLV